jgi:hypothetical protein
MPHHFQRNSQLYCIKAKPIRDGAALIENCPPNARGAGLRRPDASTKDIAFGAFPALVMGARA